MLCSYLASRIAEVTENLKGVMTDTAKGMWGLCSQSGATKGKWPNGRILCTAAIWTVPVFVIQLVIAFISLAFKQQVRHGLLIVP